MYIMHFKVNCKSLKKWKMDFYLGDQKMKKLLVGMIVLLSVVAFVNAAEPTESAIEGVDITVDTTFVTVRTACSQRTFPGSH